MLNKIYISFTFKSTLSGLDNDDSTKDEEALSI